MTSARLLLAAFALTCALPLFSQIDGGADLRGSAQTSRHFSFGTPEHVNVWNLAAQPTHGDATQRFEDAVSKSKIGRNPQVSQDEADLLQLQAKADLEMVLAPSNMVLAPSNMDGACFAIRSILVARDSKDSDATHFVRTTTCQPSSRYRVRTAKDTDSSGAKK